MKTEKRAETETFIRNGLAIVLYMYDDGTAAVYRHRVSKVTGRPVRVLGSKGLVASCESHAKGRWEWCRRCKTI